MEDINFEKSLETLNSDEVLQSSVLSKIAIENLSTIFQGDLTSIEATVYTASVFNCSDGIPNYISKVLHIGGAPVREVFELMEYIVDNFSSDVELIANDVLLWCAKLVTNVIPNETKSLLMKLAASIINCCSCYQIDFEHFLGTLKRFLTTDKKTPASLIETIFNVIGSLFKLRPEISTNDQDWFFNIIVNKMNEYRHSKNVSDILLIACFKGLCGLLVNFSPNNAECYKTIYFNLKLSSTLKDTGERNTVGKSALTMFTYHGSYFLENIYNEFKEWHRILLSWIEPNTATHIKQVGHLALIKYYKIIAGHIRNTNPDNGSVVFYYFQNHFATCGFNDFYKLKDQFAGISEFYDIYTKYQADKKLVKTLNNMIIIVQAMSENNPSILGMQLTAVSKISASYRNGSRLCKLAVSIVDVYPKVESNFQPYLLESLESSFFSWFVHSENDTKIWLDTICYQGLLICSAYPIHLDVKLLDEGNKQLSYKSYVKLWTYLLTISSRCNHSVSPKVGKLFFESFLLNYLKIMKKLDLSLNTIADDSFDPSISKQAKNPNDFQIFVNLVDLFQEIIPLSDTYQMRQLMSEVLSNNIKFCIDFPLVSGFYKILAVCFKISAKEELFDSNDVGEIVNFIKGAAQRLNLQKDDLLIANLRMILFAPVDILETILPELDAVIITGARIGRNYPDILELCIDSLDKWKSKFSGQHLESFLRKVLPYLSSILLDSKNSQCDPLNTQEKALSLKSRGVIRKRLVGLTEKKIAIIQQKLLLFISKLDPQLCSEILEPSSNNDYLEGSMLNYKIPFPDSRLLLPLNSLLPRIMELALSSTERNIRITACELLHGILLIGIARTREPGNNANLLKLMLRTSLTLSCDSDMIVRDMFNPLLIQITHYFSSKIHVNSKEAGFLIEILMDGVTHSHDYALRDFSAVCLREFIVWSARQLSPEFLAVGPYNTLAVLRMVCDYALHPDRCKRIGAAIAFNKLYNEFREDKKLLNLFWMRVYYCFICSLELCNFDEDAEIVIAALDHIQRPLLQQSQMFLTCPSDRRVPPGIEGGTLKDLAIFLFHHCKSHNQFVRDYSMSFIKNILSHLPENPTLKQFVNDCDISVALIESSEDNINKSAGYLHYILWLISENIVVLKDVTMNIFQSSQKLLTNLIKNNSSKNDPIVILCKCLTLITADLSDDLVIELARLMTENNCPHNNVDVNSAFINLVSLLKTSIHWPLFISRLPQYDEENLLKHITEPYKNYSWILKILDKANCLNFYYSGNNIIISIFECLFKKKGNKIVGISLNNRIINHLKDFIMFCIKHDLSSHMLIELLCDNSDIFIEGNKMTKGRYFFETFQSIIVPFLVRQPETTGLLRQMKNVGIDWVVIFLQHIRDGNKNDYNVKDFTFRIFNEWELWVQSIENKWKLFEVLKTLFQINSCKTTLDFSYLSIWYYDIPNDPNLEPEDVLSFFEVLPSFVSNLETENTELSKALATFEKKWLLFKKGVCTNSSMYTTSQLVIENLLICLKNTSSLVVWKFTLESITPNLKMVNDVIINEVIHTTVKCPIDHVIHIQEILFNFIFNESVERESVKFVESLITSLLNSSALSVNIRFCELFLPKLLNILEIPLTERKERDFVRKISATNITHTLYSLTTKEDRVKIQENLTIIDIKNKDIFPKIVKACEFGRIKSSDLTKNEKELLRLLNCSCVNFMCLFVSLAPDEKFYEMFLFRKNLWESAIDESMEYNITMDFKKIPQVKTIPTSITSSTKPQENRNKSLLKYAQSHASTLFQSSLSEDVRNFDLTNASIVAAENSSKITFELELDMLNQHEIVPMICGVILHMKFKEYNSWIRHLLNSLENGSKNVKLIILKIIHNLQDDVKHFYSECSPVIVKSILQLFEYMPVNYLFVDLINMLIDWKPPLPNNGNNLTKLIQCFISKINSQRRDIIKYVFVIVKNIIEEWNHLIISSELHIFLMIKLNSSPSDEIICYTYINLASILLVNNLFLLNEKDCNVLLIWLQKCMGNKKNCQMAAEVCGQLLQKCSNLHFFTDMYEQVCKNVREVQKSSTTNDITLLYHIHKFFPTICNDFTALLISRSWHDRSHQKQLSLEMLLCYVTSQSCLYDAELTTCFNIFAADILKCNIIPAQELILKIIIGVFKTLNENSVSTLMPHIVPLSRNKFVELRTLSCEILMKFYKLYNTKKQITSSLDDIKLTCKTALIDRINDIDGNLQNKCLTFWCDLDIPKITKNRLNFILTDLFSIEAEIELVEYASRLLLQSTSLSPEYNLEIFDHPLTDCTYNELKLLVSWRARYSSLAPMFVPSIATELGRLNSYMPESSNLNFRLRETARSLMFTPTLSNNNNSFPKQDIDNDDSVLEFKKPNKPYRFYRNTGSGYFAKRAVATKEKTKATYEEKLKERDSNVTIYRSYRVGDFPDIQIKNAQFITLLVAMVGKDVQFAKELFTLLVTSIINENYGNTTYKASLTQGLGHFLKHSDASHSVSIGAIFQIALNNEILLDCDDISRVARSSKLLSAGVLLLERASFNVDDGPTALKRRRMNIPNESSWLRVAEFYHEMQDFNALRGIFLDKLSADGYAKKAIISESLTDWSTAVKNYRNALTEYLDEDRKNFFNQSYLNCLANLSDWRKIKDCIEEGISDDHNQLWNDPWCYDVLLPWYLKSEMMTSLLHESQEFQNLMYKYQNEPEKAKKISLFSEEVTIAHWLNENVGKSISSMHKCFTDFLIKWSNTSQWDKQLKMSLLSKLKIISEIHCTTTISTYFTQMQDTTEILNYFGQEYPSQQSDLLTWDVRMSLRNKLLTKLKNKSMDSCDLSPLSENIIDSHLNIIQASIQQGNIHLAKKYWKSVETKEKSLNQKYRWHHLKNLITALKVKKAEMSTEQKLMEYCNIVDSIDISIDTAMAVDGTELNNIPARRTILNIVSDMIDECVKNNINYSFVDMLPIDKRNLKDFWLKSAESIVEQPINNENITEVSNTYLEMSKFCRNHNSGTSETIVKYLLKAMQCGNNEAKELFASVTTMNDLTESEELEKECQKVPTWMFLKWRHQFVAHLASKPKMLIKNILKRIAEKYPDSLSYGLRISKENFVKSLNDDRFVKELTAMVLNNPVQESFVEAIAKIANPFIKIKYYIDKINNGLDEPNFNEAEVKRIIHTIKSIALDPVIAESYRSISLINNDLNNLEKATNADDTKLALEKLIFAVKNTDMKKSKKRESKLANYSQWLSKFNWLKDNMLEIPGQYDCLSEPKPSQHIRVAFFKPDVVVMPSQREPIKITIVGSNAKEYSFLVKFGEDIRQDERVQQLLGQMNNTFRSYKSTNHVQIDGYKVIPLTSSYGLIQWVESVKSLSQIMAIPSEDISKVVEKHVNYLQANPSNILKAYMSAFLNKTNEELINAFNNCVNQFDSECLRKGLYKLSTSPEKFYWLRSNFAASLGAMSMAHWVIGVGDRHLDNILVSTVTGRVLGIDFGMAFGFATQFLPLPELIPFRLTPQIVNVFKPFNESGWLKQTMISCMRALKEDSYILLAILEVFILEPCLDWVQQAKRLAKEQGESSCFQVQWYGQSKVRVVKEKLKGGNPVKLLEADLESGRIKDDCLIRLKTVVNGVRDNIRFQQPESGLTPEQQVDTLIDLASDPLVLSLTYSGWSPWL